MEKFDLVIPALGKDAQKVLNNIEYFRKNINYKKIIFIGDDNVKRMIFKLDSNDIEFVDENSIMPNLNLTEIKELVKKRGGNPKRAYWYFQQFLKIGYCYISKDNYYMTWDSDTVPVRKIEFFDENGKPYFDLKTEYHKPYFETIKVLLGIDRQIKRSFIAEHNFFRVDYMKEMINDIMKNEKIEGNVFYEKIINAINIKDLDYSGFAEPEIYGTYVLKKHPNIYSLRKWKSLREGIFYIKQPLNDDSASWVAKQYHAISFEKHDTITKLHPIWNNKFTFKNISINFITTIMYPYMIIRKYLKRK